MKSKNKNRLVLSAVIFGVILSGYTFFEKVPDLVNVSGPFIDLSGSVGNSIGNAREAYDTEDVSISPTAEPTQEPASDITPTPVITPDPGNLPTPVITPAARIEITVGDDIVANPTIDRAEIVSIHNRGSFGVDIEARTFESLEETLKYLKKMNMDKPVVLIDNYAETNTFKAVRNALNERGITPTLLPVLK